MPHKKKPKIQVIPIECKISDMYRNDDLTEDQFLEMLTSHKKYEYHKEKNGDTNFDTIEWYSHIFHMLLTEYNLWFKDSGKYQKVDRDAVYKAHCRWIKARDGESIRN